ncbi:MAG: carboxypeptidase regulatory-like domain-containing protein [Flavobacteriales bacterium]
MLQRLLLIICSVGLLGAEGLDAQHTQVVRGKVLSASLQKPLIGAEVVILNSKPLKGASTDTAGSFRIEGVPVGRHDIKVDYLGYEPRLLRNVQVTSGKEVVLTVRLKESLLEKETVEVTAEKEKGEPLNDLASVSARQFSTEETGRYAGTRMDPARMASNFAGANSANDARNDIIVRGNSPTGVLWRMEGIDIPNPNHFSSQGATGGPISMLNNNLLANSDFLSGAFPAEYGNSTAAVFDLRMRNGNAQKMEYTGQVGINGFEAGVEGPISKEQGSSFLVNYRYSTLEVFDLLGIRFGVGGVPNYQDLSFKVNLPTENLGKFELFGIGGISETKLLDSEREKDDWSYTSSGEDLIYGSDMGTLGLTNKHYLAEDLLGNAGVSLSGARRRIDLDTLGPNGSSFRTYDYDSFDGKGSFFYNLRKKFDAQHLLKGGFRYKQLFFDHRERFYDRGLARYVDLIDSEESMGLAQGYLHWRYRVDQKLTLNSGVYYQHFFLNDSRSLEPRFGADYTIGEKASLSFGYGLHSQTQPLVIYFMKSYDPDEQEYDQTNKELGFTKSHHFVIGYDQGIAKNYRIKLEAYYQDLFNVPVEGYGKESSFSMLNLGTSLEGLPHVDSLVNEGTGRNYGLELTVEKFFSKGFYFLLTGTFYRSFYTGSDGEEHPTKYNGEFTLNALGGKEFSLGKNVTLGVNIKYAYAGGNRYTPVDLKRSRMAGQAVYLNSKAYEEQYKPYSRLDLKLDLSIEREKATHSIFATVENVTDRDNILRRTFSAKKGKMITDHQLGVFPYGGYRVTF